MQKSEITILIVEDNEALGKALSELFEREGFRVTFTTKPDEALSFIKLQTFQAAIVDCILPQLNGQDLAKEIRKEMPNIPIFLMSGVLKNANMVREALKETGAIKFFTKPFDLADMLSSIESALESLIDPPLNPLLELFTKDELTYKERIRAVNGVGDVHGFDLPWILNILMHPRISGHLNIITADGGVCGVGFRKGQIVQVNQKDSKSYFGVLMVEYGFISQENIDKFVQVSGKTKKLGERLVEENLLSPHAIQIVMAEQQGIRLSSVISNTSLKVNFIEDEDLREDASLDRTAYIDLMNEWLSSKITTDWLKAFYMPWMRYSLKKGAEFSPDHRSLSVSNVKRVPGLLDTLLSSESIMQALDKRSEPEDHLYRALHALLLNRMIKFGDQRHHGDYDVHRKRLEKLDRELKNQNYFERLGLSPKAKDSEIKRAFHDMAKILDPEKLSGEAPTDIRILTQSAFEKINEAYNALNNPETKERYLSELEKGRAEAVLQAEQLAEQARTNLTKGDVRNARMLIDQAINLGSASSELKLLSMWAKLKSPNVDKNKELLNAVREELSQLPPEDRHNALFYFVKGLHLKTTGDLEGARRSFDHVISMAPEFIDARRELNVVNIQTNSNKPVDILRGDLKDVVGMLFKKKKG